MKGMTKMKPSYIYFFFLSLIFGASAYFIFSYLISGGIILLASILFLVGGCSPLLSNFSRKLKRRKECSSFVNSFIISLSVTQSLESSFEIATSNVDKDFKKVIDSISSLEIEERLSYLSSYFGPELYPMFLSIISIYQVQGGDPLYLCGDLLAEANRIEENDNHFKKNGARNAYQFALLWGMSLVILLFLRVGLASFYSFIKDTVTFIGCIYLFYGLMLISILVYVLVYTNIPLKGVLSRRKAK